MSFGKMNTQIEIIKEQHFLDENGFSVSSPVVLATIRAYREQKHASEKWVNRSTFSVATDLFRFRALPYLTLTADMIILCDNACFEIISIEDVKGRRMYYEVLAKKVESSG